MYTLWAQINVWKKCVTLVFHFIISTLTFAELRTTNFFLINFFYYILYIDFNNLQLHDSVLYFSMISIFFSIFCHLFISNFLAHIEHVFKTITCDSHMVEITPYKFAMSPFHYIIFIMGSLFNFPSLFPINFLIMYGLIDIYLIIYGWVQITLWYISIISKFYSRATHVPAY